MELKDLRLPYVPAAVNSSDEEEGQVAKPRSPYKVVYMLCRRYVARWAANLYLGGIVATLGAGLAGCSTSFPHAVHPASTQEQVAAQAVFNECLAAHGGDVAGFAKDVNFSMDGKWGTLIQRIQPVVTDSAYRISAQERFRPGEQLYAELWQGPAGTKKVVRTPGHVEVFYNGIPTSDEPKKQAAAMTADAFQLFHFGPSFLQLRKATFVRLADESENGVKYLRLLTTLKPGFGFSSEDDVVIWIDPTTHRLFRVHMTLNGFGTTKGAHVDTTFLEYKQIGGMLVPVRFHERVRGPVQISAHHWRISGADFDRGWEAKDVSGADLSGAATAPAKAVD
ncbi:MAG: hypothetical protein ABIZ04_01065 [Opitutus sp.]